MSDFIGKGDKHRPHDAKKYRDNLEAYLANCAEERRKEREAKEALPFCDSIIGGAADSKAE